MASSKDYLEYILNQLSLLDTITYKPMMGEYILYYNGKIAGGIYDNRLLIKPCDSAVEYLKDVIYEKPYDKAKEMILVENIDNQKFLCGLFNAIYDEIYYPKSKKKAKKLTI